MKFDYLARISRSVIVTIAVCPLIEITRAVQGKPEFTPAAFFAVLIPIAFLAAFATTGERK